MKKTGSKTIRFKTDNPRHNDAIPYKRAEKHKENYSNYKQQH